MTTAKESRLRSLEQRAQVGNDAPVKIKRIIVRGPNSERPAEIWNADECKWEEYPEWEAEKCDRRQPGEPIHTIVRVIVDPPARDLN